MSHKPRWRFWAVLLILTGTLVVAHASPATQMYTAGSSATLPTQTFTISGAVRDTSGNPIAGVTVVAFGGDTPSFAQTTAQGTYAISVGAGAHDIQVVAPGFEGGHVSGITVPPSQSNVDVALTATGDPIPTNTPSATPTSTTQALRAHLPLVMQVRPPTAPPTPTVSPSTTPTIAPGGALRVSVTAARRVPSVTCQQGGSSSPVTPRPGFALFIVDVRVQNTQPATVSSDTIVATDSSGMRWTVLAAAFSDSYCPSTFVTMYTPGDRVDSFAFVVSEGTLAQPFTLTFAQATPVTFRVQGQ